MEMEQRQAGERPAAQSAKGSLSRARELHSFGQFEAARQQYEAVLGEQPDEVDALHGYGILQYQLGNPQQSEALLKQAISITPNPMLLADLGAIQVVAGRPAEAMMQFEAALKLDPGHLQSLLRLGDALFGTRRYAEALNTFDKAVIVSPLSAQALCNRGAALRALGRPMEAVESYRRALTVDGRSFESLLNLGNVLRELGRSAEALQYYDRAVELMPDSPELLSVRGITLIDLGRPGDALNSFNQAIAARPDFVEALYNSAVALERLGRTDEVVERCSRILARVPDHVRAFATRGNAFLQRERNEEALADYDRVLAIDPEAVDALSNRGTALRNLGRFEEALQSYDAALARKPDFPSVWCNKGNVMRDLNRNEEALAAFDKALEFSPRDALVWFNRAGTLLNMFRTDEALQAYGRATELNPQYGEAHFAEGVARLWQGDFARGWEKYEWRLEKQESGTPVQDTAPRREFVQPRWRGNEPLDGRTIFVYAEQGFGDTLQFSRYVEWLNARGARVIFEVQPALKDLMASLRGSAVVVATGEMPPPFDCHCPLMSLPLALHTDLDNIPNQTPYLFADPGRVEHWSRRLGPKQRLRIGLSWSGNPRHRNDRNRSIPLVLFESLMDLDVEWISLQKVVRGPDAQTLERLPILDLESEIRDFADTAAILETLDLTIAVDSSVAHLAGALNRPFWVLLTHLAEWRWMHERDDSPWYPCARLFRQDRAGDWPGVIERLRVEIGRLGAGTYGA